MASKNIVKISKENSVFAMSATNKPVATINSGDYVQFETYDCFADQICTEANPFNNFDWNRVNPATGPVFINDSAPGDVIKVYIEKIDVKSTAVSVSSTILGVAKDLMSRHNIRISTIKDNKLTFNNKVQIPIEPMIGVIGVAPNSKDGSVSCGTPDYHGGNLDCKNIKEGATVYFTVNVDGALLALGDLHAVMGDGEVSGAGAEVGGIVTVKVEVIKNAQKEKDCYPTPMIVDKTHCRVLASSKTLDEATKLANDNMLKMIVAKSYGNAEIHDASILMSLTGELGICQVVDPLVTAKFSMPLSILSQLNIKF